MKFSHLAKAFSFPAGVLAIHFFIYFLDFYEKYFWIDIPMHFLGGFSVALTFMTLIADFDSDGVFRSLPFFVLFIFVVSIVSLTAVLWEFFEFWLEITFLIKMQGGLRDTLADLFFGLLGGVFSFLIFGRRINSMKKDPLDSLTGIIKDVKKTSVELQHEAWDFVNEKYLKKMGKKERIKF